MKAITLIASLIAVLGPINAFSAPIYKCQEQYLVQATTKTGYSVRLTNKKAKESEPIYMIGDTKVKLEDAVSYATKNQEPILKEKKQ